MIILLKKGAEEADALLTAREAVRNGLTNATPYFGRNLIALSCGGLMPGRNKAEVKVLLERLPSVEAVLLADAIY